MTPYGQRIGLKGQVAGPSEPFGVQEPLLWLLHMNGYLVF